MRCAILPGLSGDDGDGGGDDDNSSNNTTRRIYNRREMRKVSSRGVGIARKARERMKKNSPEKKTVGKYPISFYAREDEA